MPLGRVHTSTKAIDVAELLVLNKSRITYPAVWSTAVPQLTGNRNPPLLLKSNGFFYGGGLV